MKKPFKLDKDLLRVDDTPIHASLRESLANALIHADYYGRCGIVIDKKFRGVTISNPGTFRISIETAIGGGISDARNSRIFNMFSLIDVGERSGSGLCDVSHNWKQNGYKQPSIVETLNPDRITLTLELEAEGNDSNRDSNDSNRDSNDSNRDSNDSNHDRIERTLSANELNVLNTLSTDPSLTANQIAKACSISTSTVNRVLKSLREKSYIKRNGTTRGEWIIL